MSSRIKALTHPQRVCLLYKSILRLHRGLPEQMQIMGDAYVKDEFRRNKTADHVQTITFMEAWAKYALTISKQIEAKNMGQAAYGEPLKKDDLELFSGEQIHQLFDLYQETSKPQDDYPEIKS